MTTQIFNDANNLAFVFMFINFKQVFYSITKVVSTNGSRIGQKCSSVGLFEMMPKRFRRMPRMFLKEADKIGNIFIA